MVLSRAAIRYAKATLALAVEQGAEDAVMLNMKELSKGIQETAEIKQLLESPLVKSERKLNFLNDYISTAHEVSKGVLRTLHENGRIELLEEVALQYLILHKKQKNEETAYVTTAIPMNEQMRIQVLNKIKESMIAEAKTQAEEEGSKMIEKAKLTIEAEKKAALEDIKKQVATLSVAVAEKMLKEELADDKKQQKYIEDSLKDIQLN